MSTTTQTLTIEGQSASPVEYELREVRKQVPPVREQPEPDAAPSQQAPSSPRLKILVAGFSFFCAGVNDGTLGPLIPYILASFSIGTGEVAIIYASTFIGWLLAAVTNPVLTAHLKLGHLLFLGAALQLLAQCIRPWAPLPLFCITFFIQALGMAYQDAHSNTFVTSVNVAHRWLGFIHAMYALGCLIGPLVATAIASNASGAGLGGKADVGKGSDGWRKVYYVLIGIGVLNLAGVSVSFADSLWTWRSKRTADEEGASAEGTAQVATRKNRLAMKEMGELLKVRDVWIISGFYFFELGASMTAGGWVVEYLTTVRHGDLSEMGYVPTGYYTGMFLGRLLLAEPTFRFGEQRMLLIYSAICIGLQLIFWLVPNIIANATALSVMGFFYGPFFATGVSVASKIFPRKIQAAALSLVFVLAQAGGAIFPSVTGLIATHAGVQVLQPIVLALIVVGTIFWWMIPKVPERRD